MKNQPPVKNPWEKRIETTYPKLVGMRCNGSAGWSGCLGPVPPADLCGAGAAAHGSHASPKSGTEWDGCAK